MEELSVGELLKKTYLNLEERNMHQEIILPNGVMTEIADDTDWHRSRTGYMRYEKVDIFDFGKSWLLGRGEKSGSYPARPYDSDILALEFSIENKESAQIQKEIEDKIRLSSYFSNSLVFGYADGNIGINKCSGLGRKMMQLIKPNVSKFIARRPEYDETVIELSTLMPPTTKEMLYKPEFASVISEAIETVLKEESKIKVGE